MQIIFIKLFYIANYFARLEDVPAGIDILFQVEISFKVEMSDKSATLLEIVWFRHWPFKWYILAHIFITSEYSEKSRIVQILIAVAESVIENTAVQMSSQK